MLRGVRNLSPLDRSNVRAGGTSARARGAIRKAGWARRASSAGIHARSGWVPCGATENECVMSSCQRHAGSALCSSPTRKGPQIHWRHAEPHQSLEHLDLDLNGVVGIAERRDSYDFCLASREGAGGHHHSVAYGVIHWLTLHPVKFIDHPWSRPRADGQSRLGEAAVHEFGPVLDPFECEADRGGHFVEVDRDQVGWRAWLDQRKVGASREWDRHPGRVFAAPELPPADQGRLERSRRAYELAQRRFP